MTIPHAQLEALGRQICETRRCAGAYEHKGCKRAHWRKRAMALCKCVDAEPILGVLYRACGWKV